MPAEDKTIEELDSGTPDALDEIPYADVSADDTKKATFASMNTAITGIYNVASYGAVGNGTTDDTAAIQAALDACPVGGIVQLEALTYAIRSSLTIPPYVTLQGMHGNQTDNAQRTSIIKCRGGVSFSGVACILMLDSEQGGYSGTSNEGIRMTKVTIDGQQAAGNGR